MVFVIVPTWFLCKTIYILLSRKQNPPLAKEPIVTVIREEDLLNYQDYPMARSYMGSYGRRGYKDVGLQPWDYYYGSKSLAY